jgi:hypothetical protein
MSVSVEQIEQQVRTSADRWLMVGTVTVRGTTKGGEPIAISIPVDQSNLGVSRGAGDAGAVRLSPASLTAAERQQAIARKVGELRARFTPQELALHLGRRRLEDLAAAEVDHEEDSFGEPLAKASTPAAVAERLRLDRVQRALRILAERPADTLIARAIEEGKVDRRGVADLSALTDEMVDRNEDLVVLAEREILAAFTAEDLDHQARACRVTRAELVRQLAIDRLREAGISVPSADVCKAS